MRRLVLIWLLSIVLQSCNSQDCGNLPERFSSYSQAISLVKRCNFIITESANASNSSWITSANYFSCDGYTGYLIYKTNRGYEYIHSGIPIYIWQGFKNSTSKGSYYNAYIKNRYRLRLH